MQRRRLRFVITVVAGGAAVAAGLTACTSSDSASTANGPVTLTVGTHQQLRADMLKKEIPGFESAMKKQGKDIKVKLITDVLTDEQWQTKVTQQYHAGTAPDVEDMGSDYINSFAGAGYLLPLNSYLSKWPGWSTYYAPVKSAVKSPDGEVYGLVHEASTQSLFVRKDVLQKDGVDISQPATWDDLIARLKQITAKSGNPSIVYPAGTAWGDGTWQEGFRNLVVAEPNSIFDSKSGKWIVKSQGISDTFALYGKLLAAKVYPVQDLLNPNPWVPTKYKGFVNGSIPVAGQGTWGWKYDWGPQGSAPLPGLESKVITWKLPALTAGGTPYATLSPGFVYAISKNTQHAQAAVDFAEYMSSGKAMADQLVGIGAAAPRSGISGIAPYSQSQQLLNAENALKTARVVPTADGAQQMSQAVQNATEDMLTGKANASQAAAEFAKQATDLLGASRVEG